MDSMVLNIIFAIVLIIIIYLIIKWVSGGNEKYLSSINDGNKKIVISSSDISSNKNSNNFAYSIWFYVDDWQYRLSETKELLKRNTRGGDNHNPHISFPPYENNINITIDTMQNNNSNDPNPITNKNNCSVRNFPLQRWVNLLISLNGRTLDVYVDGKLVRTCILPGVAKPLGDSDLLITPNGGFGGWTSRLQYWSHPINPQEAFNIYRNGPSGGSNWLSLFDHFKIKVSLLIDNVQKGSFTI